MRKRCTRQYLYSTSTDTNNKYSMQDERLEKHTHADAHKPTEVK